MHHVINHHVSNHAETMQDMQKPTKSTRNDAEPCRPCRNQQNQPERRRTMQPNTIFHQASGYEEEDDEPA